MTIQRDSETTLADTQNARHILANGFLRLAHRVARTYASTGVDRYPGTGTVRSGTI